MECSFTVKRKEWLGALLHFRKIAKSAKKQEAMLEITVTDGCLTLNIPGGEQHIQAQTKGTVKFAIRLWFLAEVVSGYDVDSLTCIVTEDTLKINNTFFNVLTTFFTNDNILRSINLPLNYAHVDLYRLKHSNKYTKQEIEFNKLTDDIEYAELQIKLDVDDVSKILRKYGFSKKEITEIIMTKLNASIPTKSE